MVIAVSWRNTSRAAWHTASGNHRIDFARHNDDPAWSGFSLKLPEPTQGPLERSLISLAILKAMRRTLEDARHLHDTSAF